eukprot:gene9381-biopygen5070
MTPPRAIHGIHGSHERPRECHERPPSSLVRSVLNIHEIREWPREWSLDGPVGGPVDGLAPRGAVERPAASTGLFTGPPTGPDATRFTGPFTGVFSPVTARGCSRGYPPVNSPFRLKGHSQHHTVHGAIHGVESRRYIYRSLPPQRKGQPLLTPQIPGPLLGVLAGSKAVGCGKDRASRSIPGGKRDSTQLPAITHSGFPGRQTRNTSSSQLIEQPPVADASGMTTCHIRNRPGCVPRHVKLRLRRDGWDGTDSRHRTAAPAVIKGWLWEDIVGPCPSLWLTPGRRLSHAFAHPQRSFSGGGMLPGGRHLPIIREPPLLHPMERSRDRRRPQPCHQDECAADAGGMVRSREWGGGEGSPRRPRRPHRCGRATFIGAVDLRPGDFCAEEYYPTLPGGSLGPGQLPSPAAAVDLCPPTHPPQPHPPQIGRRCAEMHAARGPSRAAPREWSQPPAVYICPTRPLDPTQLQTAPRYVGLTRAKANRGHNNGSPAAGRGERGGVGLPRDELRVVPPLLRQQVVRPLFWSAYLE